MLSEILKEKTKHLHAATEEKFNSNKIFDKNYSSDEYNLLLNANYKLFAQYEKAVFAAIPDDFAHKINATHRIKLPSLAADADHRRLPKLTENVAKENLDPYEAIGILYVMEGSSLGGNMIRKQLSKNPAFENVTFHYFGFYGEKTGEYWKLFKTTLDESIPEVQYQAVWKGAQKAYDFLLHNA